MTRQNLQIVDDIASHCMSPEIAQLVRIWSVASLVRGGDLPPVSAFNLATLAPYAGNMVLLESFGPKSYIYLYCGKTVVDIAGRDMTGKTTDDLPGNLSFILPEQFRESKRRGRPIYCINKSVGDNAVKNWERLILPIDRGDGHVLIVIYSAAVLMKDKITDATLELNANPVFALRLIRENGEPLNDAVILASNGVGRNLFCRDPEAQIAGKRLSRLIPEFESSEIWDEIERVERTGELVVIDLTLVLADSPRSFRVRAAPMDSGITLTFTDISDIISDSDEVRVQHAELVFENETLVQQASNLAALAEELEKSRQQLSDEVERRTEAEARLHAIANTDALTGIMNRRALFEYGSRKLAQGFAMAVPVSVIIVDIDYFKQVNDTHGHATGDTAIVSVARVLSRLSGPDDIVGRLGGEEFVVLAFGNDLSDAMILSERMRREVAALAIQTDGPDLKMTASFGVAAAIHDEETMDSLLVRADAALYQAKATGRNKVMAEDDVIAISGDKVLVG